MANGFSVKEEAFRSSQQPIVSRQVSKVTWTVIKFSGCDSIWYFKRYPAMWGCDLPGGACGHYILNVLSSVVKNTAKAYIDPLHGAMSHYCGFCLVKSILNLCVIRHAQSKRIVRVLSGVNSGYS